jgi:integrase
MSKPPPPTEATMKRRAKGTGTIVKIGNVYYGRISIKGKVRKVRLSTNQREAASLWADWVRQNVTTLKTEATKHKLDELWPNIREDLLWRALTESRIGERRRYYENIVEWLGKRGKKFAEEVGKADIVEFMTSQTEGAGFTLKRSYLTAFKDIFRASVPDMMHITSEVKVKHPPTIPRDPFTADEIRRIMEEAEKKGAEWKVLVMIGLYTGLRLVDCVHLRVEDIKDDTIMVVPQKTKRLGTIVRIPLHPVLKTALDGLGVASGHFLPGIVEKYRQTHIRGEIRQLFTAAVGDTCKEVDGRKRKVTCKGFHALRATFITRLAERGVSLPIMESLAGHINPEQTMRYTHPDEETKRLAVSVMPDFGKDEEAEKIFVHPEVQRVIDICKKQIEETIEKIMGKKVEVEVKVPQEILGGEEAFLNL